MKIKTWLSISIIPLLIMSMLVNLPVMAQNTNPKSGGSITVALVAEPKNLNPYTGAWHSGFIDAQIFNSLLELDGNLQSKPCLAESWKILEGEKAYLFKLREGVKWQDGKPLTAEDVKFSFEKIISKYDIFGALYFNNTIVDIIDDRTVKIKPGVFLPAAQVLLFSSIDTAIVPKHLLEGKNFLKSDFITHPIGTGPFKFKEWVKGSYITLVKNGDYWKSGKPYLNEIVVKFITDPSTLVASLQTGEVNYVFRGLPYETYKDLANKPSLDVIKSVRPPYKMFLSFNLKNNILSNKLVRKAIAYALNRTDISKKATLGVCNVTNTWLPESEIQPSSSIKIYEYNPQKAEKLLDQAGYPKGPDGKRFTIELLTRTGEAEESEIADLIKNYLGNVGIDVKIKKVDFGTMLDLTGNFNYDMVLWKSWISSIWEYQQYTTEWIIHNPFANIYQYSNPEVDNLFHEWLHETNPSKQKILLQKIDVILTDDLPQIPLYNVVFLNAKSKNVKGPDIPVGKYVFWDPLENTYLETPPPTPEKGGQRLPIELIVALAIVIIVVIVAAVLLYRRH